MKTAIIMISIGDRDWVGDSLATFVPYCQKHNIDLVLVTGHPSEIDFPFPEVPETYGRQDKLAYASKLYYAWHYLEEKGYDRVAIVDDSCCIRISTPNLFSVVPYWYFGFTGTGIDHADDSFRCISEYLEKNDLDEIEMNPGHYMNSGVLLYDRSFKDAIHKDKIVECSDLFLSKFPDQTAAYFLLKKAGVPFFRMPKSFNSVPAADALPDGARELVEDVRPYLNDGVHVYHVTGAYKHRGRLVKQISKHILSENEAIK